MAFPDVPDTGTVTTYTIGSTGDYATIAAFQSAIGTKDLVTATTSYILEIQGETIDENGTNITGWTTNSTYYIYIRPVSGAEHNGVLGAGPILRKTTNGGSVLIFSSSYISINGIEFRHTGAAVGDGLNFNITNCHAQDCISNAVVTGFVGVRNSTTVVNCLALNCTADGYDSPSSSTGTILNSLAVDCATGFEANLGGTIVKNCHSYGATTASYSGTFDTSNSTNNAASDADPNTPPGSNPITTNTVSTDFEDYANDDYHLASGSTLIDAGADLTASGYTTDWEGDARPDGSAWDIGPDQVAGDISITDVANSGETPGSGTESWDDGSTGNVITGSGFV